MWLASHINSAALTSQVDCTVSFTLTGWRTAQTCTGTFPFVPWVLLSNTPTSVKRLSLLLNATSSSESSRTRSPGADRRRGSEFRGQQLGRAAEPVLSRYLQQVHKDPPELAPECDRRRVWRPPASVPQHARRSADSRRPPEAQRPGLRVCVWAAERGLAAAAGPAGGAAADVRGASAGRSRLPAAAAAVAAGERRPRLASRLGRHVPLLTCSCAQAPFLFTCPLWRCCELVYSVCDAR